MADFSRREREIMNALYASGEADVEQIRSRLAEPPGYDSVRTILRILEEKGHVRRRVDGRRHIYKPIQNKTVALGKAWRNLVNTFFGGSQEAAAATLLRASEREGLDDGKVAELLAQAKGAAQRRKARRQ